MSPWHIRIELPMFWDIIRHIGLEPRRGQSPNCQEYHLSVCVEQPCLMAKPCPETYLLTPVLPSYLIHLFEADARHGRPASTV